MDIREMAFGDLVEIARRYQSVSVLVLHNMITDSSDFRCAKKGESYFDADGEKRVEIIEYDLVRVLICKRQAISHQVSTTITVQDVYGHNVEIPEGYKFVRFGIPKPNEKAISTGRVDSFIEGPLFFDGKPRIIVEKI